MIQIKVVVVVGVTHLWLLKRNFLPNLWGHDNSQLLMGSTCQTYGNMIWQQLLMGTTCHDNSQLLILMGLTCHNWAKGTIPHGNQLLLSLCVCLKGQ